MDKKKKAVPKILPREPLTKKARGAIDKYVEVKLRGSYFVSPLVKAVLEAERMRRADLYGWLEGRGFRWQPRYGFWVGGCKPKG